MLSERLHVMVSEEDARALRAESDRTGAAVAEIVRRAIGAYLAEAPEAVAEEFRIVTGAIYETTRLANRLWGEAYPSYASEVVRLASEQDAVGLLAIPALLDPLIVPLTEHDAEQLRSQVEEVLPKAIAAHIYRSGASVHRNRNDHPGTGDSIHRGEPKHPDP